MPSLSVSKLVLVFSVVSVIVMSNADDVPKPYKLVHNVCKKLKLRNTHFCSEVLKSDTRSKFANDITTLTTIAIDVAAKNATATRDYFLGVTTGHPAVLKSLKDCIVPYNNVIASFKICLKEDDCNLIGYDIHNAGDEVRRCQMFTDSNGAHDSFITARNNVTEYLCGLGEVLANFMCNQKGA